MKTPSFTPSIGTISIFHDKSAVTFTTSLTPPTRIFQHKRASRKRVEWQGIFVLFADGLPDDCGGVMRTKMAARGAFEAECKGMRPLWPVNVKRRAANVRKPVSFVKQM